MIPTNLRQGTGVDNAPMPGMGGASNGQMPVGAVPGTPGGTPLNTVQNNPFAAPGATGLPVTGAVPGATVNTSAPSPVNWTTGDHSVVGDFQNTFGNGTGTAITDVLKGLGTSTDSAVQSTINATNLAADKQFGNIRAAQAAGGITPSSSTAALAAGDFWSTVNTNLQGTISGMELSQEDTLLQALMGEGAAHGGDTSTWDSITAALGSILPGLSKGAQGISSVVSSHNPGADTSWLDALGALA